MPWTTEDRLPAQTRDYQYDNLRFLLIFLVVAGHGLELFMKDGTENLYRVIYSFHMPAFLFVTGKFAKYDARKVLRRLIVPYLVFQPLYLLFSAKVLTGKEFTLQYTTPYWILWYLLAVIAYFLLIPLLPRKKPAYGAAVLGVSVPVALLAGFDKTAGYYLSISRILVFAPFFLWGYYDGCFREALGERKDSRLFRFGLPALCLLLLAAGEFYIIRTEVPVNLLYGSYSYESCGGSLLSRAVITATAACWIFLLTSAAPKRRIPVISTLGQNTMPVFLLHGFLLRLAGKYRLLHFSQGVNLLLVCAGALAIIAIFGNKYIGKAFRKLF